MTLAALQALTWGTVTSAVVGALMLASADTELTELSLLRLADGHARASAANGSSAVQRPVAAGTAQIAQQHRPISAR